MKLDDPFGRVGRRRAANAHALRQQLADQGITDADAVRGVLRRAGRTATLLAAVVAVSALALGALFRELSALVMLAAALTLLWIGAGFLLIRTHLREIAREYADAATRVRSASHDDKGDPV